MNTLRFEVNCGPGEHLRIGRSLDQTELSRLEPEILALYNRLRVGAKEARKLSDIFTMGKF